MLPVPILRPDPPLNTTTEIFTSSGTYVAGAAGIYRVMALPSGGSGAVSNPGPPGGGGSGIPVYNEVVLGTGENVAVTIGAGQTNSSGPGVDGNTTSFGTHFSAFANGTAGGATFGGDGWGGGGCNGGDGGSLTEDGLGTGAGSGTGTSVFSQQLAFFASKFPEITFSAGTPGDGIAAAGGGAGGLLIDGAGPIGGSSTGGKAGGGDGYGAGGSAVQSSNFPSNPSQAGLLIVSGPYGFPS